MAQTHDLTEWAAFLSLGTGITATGWLLWFEPLLDCDLDPRPVGRRAADRVLVELVNARYTTRDALVGALLLTTAPKGALR